MYCQVSNFFYSNVDTLEKCTSLDEIADVCHAVFANIGCPVFKYAWMPPRYLGINKKLLFFSRPNVSLDSPNANWMRENDPKIKYCAHHVRPAVWDSAFVDRFLCEQPGVVDEVLVFWEHAFGMGMTNLITVPIRGTSGSIGMLSLVSVEQHAVSFPFIEAWAHYLQNRVEHLFAQAQVSEPLSPREIEVLRWVMLGKTAAETGMIMSISENTVLFHLKNLKHKLNVANKYHMVAKALALGILTP
ncbi:hypothetical protein CAI21_12645 [Alkalilimnicola ehrlichii]|uniref:HTH luxR-type domain-containing protein n=1 Tax=Alkalilimnicola ehrlichii TaxID=351052 RepID=A0A3E0WZK9_9GAMM|nr:LuxR family transcriptional regulator [Alkalilimnicola ehrlichii]RFA28412.1 hypothetical protein CAI21_12645 [Alkalilimnicola ehrlichii]RFA38521.1 hypothetical protein CAL65_04005 [Alkalilimnicola ehrlichii]